MLLVASRRSYPTRLQCPTKLDHMSSTICRFFDLLLEMYLTFFGANPLFSFHPDLAAGLAIWYSTDSPSASVAAAHTHFSATRHRHPRLHDQFAASGQLEVSCHYTILTAILFDRWQMGSVRETIFFCNRFKQCPSTFSAALIP